MNPTLPQHIAIIMDGNGRWAKQRGLPRTEGHRQGVQSVRLMIERCIQHKIPYLTLFAFGTDNWKRPFKEVQFLWGIFLHLLKNEAEALHRNGVRIRFIGELNALNHRLQKQIEVATKLTEHNTTLTLVLAVNYGGRWDILQACQTLAEKAKMGLINPADITEEVFQSHLSLGNIPEPDLMIRTGGDARISNFLLWHLKYTELHFTPIYWPDFREEAFDTALKDFQGRERRFGKTGEQIS